MWPSDDMRLLCAALLNAAVFTGAYLFARRATRDAVQRFIDTLLVGFAVQYAAVVLPGLLHVLHPLSIAATALLLSAGLGWIGLRRTAAAIEPTSTPAFSIGLLFVAGAVGAWANISAVTPVSATDPLTYHLPVAVTWLQDGRLSLFPTWFFNPANTYSPLAGSAFITWWIAPLHNDVLARFVQIPPLLLIFAALVQTARAGGAARGLAVIAATAAVLSRPLLGEALLAKDDLYLAAFFTTAVAGCATDRLRDRDGPWRIGVAVGLMLATKYTALLSLPILLLVVDAPRAAGWGRRQWGIALGLPLLLAGPWYLRNLLTTGNPVFPLDVTLLGRRIFTGLLAIEKSEGLRTLAGTRQILFNGYFSIPTPLAVLLAAGWGAALVATGRRLWRDPVARACVLGPVVGIVLFLSQSPYPEVRFIFPSLALLFACAAVGLSRLTGRVGRWLGWSGALGVLVVSLFTTHKLNLFVEAMIEAGSITAAVGGGFLWIRAQYGRRNPARFRQGVAVAVVVGSLALSAEVYVYWIHFVNQYRAASTPEETDRAGFWDQRLPGGNLLYAEGPAWQFVRRNAPPEATIAYANTHLVYPLMGFDLNRRVVYVPPRPEVDSLGHLPHLPHPVSGEAMTAAVTEILNANPDRAVWLRRLRDSGAKYLVVVKSKSNPAPEIQMAAADPARFLREFEDDAAVVYRIAP